MQRFGQGSPYLRIKGILTTPEGKAAWNVMQKFPASDVHMYLFGPDGIYQNGYQPGNYFDSVGTQLASVDGSVGAVLDAAGSVGDNLADMASFSNLIGTAWSYSGGMLQCNGTSGSAGYAALTLGKTYKYRAVITGGNVNLYIGSATYVLDVSGTYEWIGMCAGNTNLMVQNTTAGAKTVTLTVKEVTGIHATQSTPGFKPTLRKGIVNLCRGNGAPAGASFTRINCAVTDNYAVSPDGTTTASRLQITAANGALQQSRPELNGTGFSQAVYVKSNTGSPQAYQYWNGSATISGTATADWQLVSSGVSNFAAGSRFDFGSPTNGADLLIWRPGLFQGTLTAAQILAAGGIPLTTTAPASSQAGVNYLEFDGDAKLNLGRVPFNPGEPWSMVISASIDQVGGYPFLISPSFNSAGNTVGVSFFRDPLGYITCRYKNDAGNVTWASVGGGVYADFKRFTLSAVFDGSNLSLCLDGGLVQVYPIPAGTYTVDSSILCSGDTSMVGRIFAGVLTKGALQASDIKILEKQVSAGIQL